MEASMNPKVSIGIQNFEKLRKYRAFYVDKTDFIREWWENADEVTLITRPRRFGKTLNLSMMECFFSTEFAGRGDLFEDLSVWKHEKYRQLQGTYPVIFVSFAGVKGSSFENARDGIIGALDNAFQAHIGLADSKALRREELLIFDELHTYGVSADPQKVIKDSVVVRSLQLLCSYLERCYGKKVLVFLDEYDTPLQEAYVFGYWDKMVDFIRTLFNLTFKTNPFLERALLTGITRVSKESIFSDLNNLEVVTTTSDKYCTAFGFTQDEVFQALDDRRFSGEKEHIKFWYDGFTFGRRNDIFNPWSITKFLDSGQYGPHWADTSSNRLVSELIMGGTAQIKMDLEALLDGQWVETELDEQIIFEHLKRTKGAVWSLLMASGYLKPVDRMFNEKNGKYSYRLKITNHEVTAMFRSMISNWFPEDHTSYSNFKEALMLGDLDYMNQFMNEVSQEMFGSFDTGRRPSDQANPERFYHGFVLGLVVDLAGRYHIRSNRQSGFGRYDVMMEPKNQEDDGIIIEFKVLESRKDKTLEQAVENALKQIEEKKYDTELIARGISQNRIRHYGFAFDGQKVLIGER